jgi:DNA-binding NarL/FixJ family response regulator
MLKCPIGLSSSDEHYMVEDMLGAGAVGYLLKDAGKMQIMEAIDAAVKKQKYFCNAIRRIMDMHNATYPLEPGERKKLTLSPRQTEILHLSKRTVEGFRRKFFEKTNAQNEAGLAIYAINNGIYKQ